MTTTRLAPISAGVMAVLLLFPMVVAAAPKPAVKTVAAKAVLVSMKQVTVTIDPAADAKANADKIAAFQSATLGIFSCADVADIAQSVGASVTDANAVPLTALPPALRETVRTMTLGTATQMFGDRSEGKVRVLVLCARAVER